MALTDTAIRQAKPREKAWKKADEKGLYLVVTPSGGKLWRMDYRFMGKRKTLAIGMYPDVGLAAAREKRDDARQLLAQEIDPGEVRKAIKSTGRHAHANSFEVIAREWFAKFEPTWAPNHASKVIERLERDVFPWIGSRPISEITAPELLTVVNRIDARGVRETAHRAKQNCGQVFRWAVQTGRAERDPTTDLRGALPPTRTRNFPSITDPAKVGDLLRTMDAFKGTFPVRCALLLAPLVFVRPGELRKAKWEEFSLDKAEWNIPADRMKGWRRKGVNHPHLVPLARQAMAILLELQPLTGRGEYLFPGHRDPKRPMSDATVNAALRRMGYDTRTEITGHGFRSTARTILHEELGFESAVIEHQLAHAVPDPLGTAYNRTKFIKQRRVMMQRWADYLDQLRAGAQVVEIRA